MQIVGKTPENLPVMEDVFLLVGTRGMPLEFILERFKERGVVMDWPAYVADAMKDGAKMRTVRARVISAVGEVYGGKYLVGFEARFDAFFADQ